MRLETTQVSARTTPLEASCDVSTDDIFKLCDTECAGGVYGATLELISANMRWEKCIHKNRVAMPSQMTEHGNLCNTHAQPTVITVRISLPPEWDLSHQGMARYPLDPITTGPRDACESSHTTLLVVCVAHCPPSPAPRLTHCTARWASFKAPDQLSFAPAAPNAPVFVEKGICRWGRLVAVKEMRGTTSECAVVS